MNVGYEKSPTQHQNACLKSNRVDKNGRLNAPDSKTLKDFRNIDRNLPSGGSLSIQSSIIMQLIEFYFQLVAHVILFVMLMGLAHAEEMRTILGIDIADQKEREDYYEVVTNAKGESLNQIRFKSASHLASFTLLILYIGTVVASVNLFSSLGLFIGVFKNKTELMLPWLVLDMLGVVIILAIMIFVANGTFVCFVGGQWQYSEHFLSY